VNNLKKINIVKDNKDFDRIIQNNKPFKYQSFLVYLEKDKENYRFGISVSKKICNAVGRNKIKRQIRSIIDSNKYQNNFDCIIIARKSILNYSFSELEEQLNYCFKKLNILKGEINEK
jgi:ribonuclease P protein component